MGADELETIVDSAVTAGILAARLRRLIKLAEIVRRDDLAGTLQGVLEELKQPLDTDTTELAPELLESLRRRVAKASPAAATEPRREFGGSVLVREPRHPL